MIELITNGQRYTGWTSVEVIHNLEALNGVFEVSLVHQWEGNQHLADVNEGSACQLLLDGELVIAGYVDDVIPELGGVDGLTADGNKLTIRGQDKTGDLVACSAMPPPSQWKGQTALAIAQSVCAPFGISVTAQADVGAPFPTFALEPGETVYALLSRLCQARGLLMAPTATGNLVITKVASTLQPVALREGVNILSGSAPRNAQNSFSQVTVQGQSTGEEQGRTRSGAKATIMAPYVNRYRPLLVVATEAATQADCERQAKWEMANRNGKALQARIKVQGWRQQAGGDLWRINQLVQVDSPTLFVREPLVISEAIYTYDDKGTRCELTLVRREALLPEPVPAPKAKATASLKKKRRKTKGETVQAITDKRILDLLR